MGGVGVVGGAGHLCPVQTQGLLWRHLGLPGGRAGQLSAHTWEPGVLGKPRGHQARGLRSLDKPGVGGIRHSSPLTGPRHTWEQGRHCPGGRIESRELSSCTGFTGAGSRRWGLGVSPGSEALPGEPPGQALAQWFLAHEPFLGRTSVSSQGLRNPALLLLQLEERGPGAPGSGRCCRSYRGSG